MRSLFFAVLLLAGAAFAQEDRLIAVLKSDAPLNEKVDACQQLARVGTRQAVPVLATLLADERLSHMARFALEPIPDPSVDAALREALGKVKGQLLVGVISSLGVRKDQAAIGPLGQLLAEPDSPVAQAAARALGSIGASAAPALENALANASPTNQRAICEGLLRCAAAMSFVDSVVIYDKLRTVPNQPLQVRVAALRGAILSRGARGTPLMIDAFRTESDVPAADVLRISREIPGREVTKTLTGELGRASEEKQILLLQTLGDRHDQAAARAVMSLAQKGPASRRVAAIRCLAQLAEPSSLPGLAALTKDPEASVSSAAWAGLIGFPGKKADAAVMGLLKEPEPKNRIAAIDAVAQRRITTAVPALLVSAHDADTGVVSASFKALGELATAADIPRLVDATLQTKAVPAAEAALAATCSRQTDPATCADAILAGLPKAQGESRLALLRILGILGGPKALAAVRVAATDTNESVKDTALQALCDWPTADALPDLAQVARTNATTKFKILALRGQLRLIPQQSVPDAQKLSQVKQLLPLLEHPEEQRLALALLGELPSAESLALVAPYLANGSLKEEASVAAVAVAEKIVTNNPAEVADAMKQVQTRNNQVADRAKKLLARVSMSTAP